MYPIFSDSFKTHIIKIISTITNQQCKSSLPLYTHDFYKYILNTCHYSRNISRLSRI